MRYIEPVFSLSSDPALWSRHLNEYPRLQGFRFNSLEDCHRCIYVAAEVPGLKGMPIEPLGGHELVIPSEGAKKLSAALNQAGIPFKERRVRETASIPGPVLHVQRTPHGWEIK